MSDLLIPQLRAYPPQIASRENPLLAALDDSVAVTNHKHSPSLTLSDRTLRSTVLASPPQLSSTVGIQRAYNFPSSPVHFTKDFTLHTILQHPSILARLIAYLDWFDLYHLLCTCQHIRDLFRDTCLRDVILTRFVVGYGHCLRTRDLNHFQDVQISIHDLDLLCTSSGHTALMTSKFTLIM